MSKLITLSVEEYEEELAAAFNKGAKSGKYGPVIELVKEITSWYSVRSSSGDPLRSYARAHTWSGAEIESKLRNAMYSVGGYE